MGTEAEINTEKKNVSTKLTKKMPPQNKTTITTTKTQTCTSSEKGRNVEPELCHEFTYMSFLALP